VDAFCTVECKKATGIVSLIDAVAIDHRRGKAAHESGDGPLDGVLAQLAFTGGVEGQDHAHFVAIQIFVAVGGDGVFAVQHDTGVEPPLGDDQAEDRLSGLRLHSQGRAIGSPGQQ
jgi:hypothetical protein